MSRVRCIAVDLDGTLATYDGWQGVEHIGDPVPAVADRVRRALAAGVDVFVFTARVAPGPDAGMARAYVESWCQRVFNQPLPVTATKLRCFDEIWDDKAVAVQENQGESVRRETGMWQEFGE